MEKIYLIKVGTSENRKFAWASGYGPLAEGMPFLHPVELDRFRRYWEVNPAPPGINIDPGGNVWPDFLGNGNPSPSFFVSERVLESFNRENIKFYRATNMPIAQIKAKALVNTPAPRYFVLETIPGIEVDFEASKIPTDPDGKPILKPLPKLWPPLIRLKEGSWKGLDLFSYSNFGKGPYLDMLCTQRVKNIADKENWTNVEFQWIRAV